ncbi:MAG TPA: DoxX family protein [Aeromicrobium sp.]|nr:DoxX family protein [Aeromicrobium sp.]
MSYLLSAARVALGALWLHEGLVKWHAGFGRPDILLVADGARTNNRVPGYFGFFAEHLLRPMADVAGVVVPIVEVGLGVALVLGVLTLPVALGSLFNLLVYWCSDQLVGQYPIMAALSALVIAWPAAASRLSLPAFLGSRQAAPVAAPAEA